MGQVLHGSATTTEAVRRAIQHSQASLRTLAKRHGINQKTVAKAKRRTPTADLPTGPTVARSMVQSIKEGAVIVAYGLTAVCFSHKARPQHNSHLFTRWRGRAMRTVIFRMFHVFQHRCKGATQRSSG